MKHYGTPRKDTQDFCPFHSARGAKRGSLTPRVRRSRARSITVQRVVSGRRKKKRGSEASRDTLGSVKFVRFRAVAIRGNFLRKRTKARGPRGAGLRTDSVRLATDRRTGSQLPSSCGGSMKIEREFANAPRCPLRGFIGPGDPRGCRLYSLAFSHSIANACKCNTYGTWEDSKKISERG